jgi:ActR/RegA family two-component response regulator
MHICRAAEVRTMSISELAGPHATTFADENIHAEDLFLHAAAKPPNYQPAPSSQLLNLDEVVRHHIHFVLHLNRGNKLKTARQLGISRSTLYRILDSESVSL